MLCQKSKERVEELMMRDLSVYIRPTHSIPFPLPHPLPAHTSISSPVSPFSSLPFSIAQDWKEEGGERESGARRSERRRDGKTSM